MSRFALLIWVFSPLLVIAALAMMMDRRKGDPDPRLTNIAAARLPGQAEHSPRPQAQLDREMAETEARKAAQGGHAEQPPTSQPAGAAGPKMVQPESLEQGFIILVNDAPQKAGNDTPIFLASSHNGWNPGDQAMKLTRRSDMRWQIILPKPRLDSRIAFKFTRGTWDMVECKDSGEDIDNRLLPEVDVSKLEPGAKPVIELTIASWKDTHVGDPARAGASPYRPIKVSAGSIRRVEVVGGGSGALVRDLLVWLPPGYDDAENAQRRYAVLYLHDGQNLFEKTPAIPAEWAVDETVSRLVSEGKIEPIIVVGIPHAGADRISEYTPVPIVEGKPATGEKYVEFLVGEVKPRVDALFRTKPDASNTAVGGASLGGAISLTAATLHPEVFGKVLAESTPMLANKKALFMYFGKQKKWPAKVYFGMGGREDAKDAAASQQYAASASAFGELLKGRGFSESNLRIVVEPDAVHNEQAWAGRLGAALEFLFPPVAGGTPSTPRSGEHGQP